MVISVNSSIVGRVIKTIDERTACNFPGTKVIRSNSRSVSNGFDERYRYSQRGKARVEEESGRLWADEG